MKQRGDKMIKFIKQLFCKHYYVVEKWHYTHGQMGNEPAYIEGFAVCQRCGKERYFAASRDSKLGEYIEQKMEDRRR